jgi:hypothetical protein
MRVVIELTKDEIDAIQLSISDAEYWARQMWNSNNPKDAELFSERALVLKNLLGKTTYAD